MNPATDELLDDYNAQQAAKRAENRDQLLETQADLLDIAEDSINTQTDVGAAKGYSPRSWRTESVRRHVDRAINHAITSREIAEGERTDDGENHLQAAVCRMAMAGWVASNT